ncbi:hypothetical protein Tco_1451201, partial [Tanacetum coccineum]
VIDNGGKRKRQNEQLGVEGVKMLKVRVALDKKGVYNLKATQVVKKNNLKPINRNLESGNTFDEDSETDSECDLYQKTKLESDAKLAAKAQKYSGLLDEPNSSRVSAAILVSIFALTSHDSLFDHDLSGLTPSWWGASFSNQGFKGRDHGFPGSHIIKQHRGNSIYESGINEEQDWFPPNVEMPKPSCSLILGVDFFMAFRLLDEPNSSRVSAAILVSIFGLTSHDFSNDHDFKRVNAVMVGLAQLKTETARNLQLILYSDLVMP